MNANTQTRRSTLISPRARMVFVRCAWKEYRMLRGFWLGIGAIAACLMLSYRGFFPGATPGWHLAAAWGAAALYAIGAAVTLFAAEREDRTNEYLQLLPQHNAAMLAGKIAAAALSALLLAVALALVGGFISGNHWPSAAEARLIISVGIVTVAEALVWGILASLVCPQPLLAAILAIAAASIGVQLAIFATPHTRGGLSWSDYHDAIPLRWLLAAIVSSADVWLSLRWLHAGPERSGRGLLASINPWHTEATAENSAGETSAAMPQRQLGRASRRAMFTRLWWQSWREGWPAMLLALPVGVFLMIAEGLVSYPIRSGLHNVLFMLPLTLLAAPAIYGALVFRADQKRRQYRFLAEHAARPSMVWWARQAAWLTPAFAMAAALTLVAIALLVVLGAEASSRLLHTAALTEFSQQRSYVLLQAFALESGSLPLVVLDGVLLGWCSLLAAYAIGQLASMLVRLEVLAGFVAALLSIVLTLWCYVLVAWELSPLLFVLPLAVAALAATRLRTPSWLTERGGWKSILAPLALVVGTMAAVAVVLPTVRLSQLAGQSGLPSRPLSSLASTLNQWESEEPAARAVALNYEELAATLNSTGKVDFEALTNNSLAPHCRFSVTFPDSDQSMFESIAFLQRAAVAAARALMSQGELDEAWSRHLTARRMQAHLAQYQPSYVVYWDFGRAMQEVDAQGRDVLMQFATAPGQTTARLRNAAESLLKVEDMFPRPSDHAVADYLEVRKVVLRQQSPQFLDPDKKQLSLEWLAFFANELPWECERALAALAVMTEAQVDFANAATFRQIEDANVARYQITEAMMTKDAPADSVVLSAATIRQMLYDWANDYQPHSAIPSGRVLANLYGWPSRRHALLRASRTSYLASFELDYRTDVPQRVTHALRQKAARDADVIRLALVAYRLDRGDYPASLAELVPNYMRYLPVDPFADGSFEYEREGFELPLLPERTRDMSEAIPAGTPLVWSVGPENAAPTECVLETDAGSSADDEAAPEKSVHRVMRLVPTEYYGWSEGAVVAALPSGSLDKPVDALDEPND